MTVAVLHTCQLRRLLFRRARGTPLRKTKEGRQLPTTTITMQRQASTTTPTTMLPTIPLRHCIPCNCIHPWFRVVKPKTTRKIQRQLAPPKNRHPPGFRLSKRPTAGSNPRSIITNHGRLRRRCVLPRRIILRLPGVRTCRPPYNYYPCLRTGTTLLLLLLLPHDHPPPRHTPGTIYPLVLANDGRRNQTTAPIPTMTTRRRTSLSRPSNVANNNDTPVVDAFIGPHRA